MANNKRDNRSWARELALVSQLGLVFTAPVVLCALVGAYIDKRAGAHGLILVVAVLVGVAAGSVAAYRLIAQVMK